MSHSPPFDDDLLEQICEDERNDMLQRVRAFEIAEIAESSQHDGA